MMEQLAPLKLPSRVQPITYLNRTIWLKRDDEIHHYFSGNKARKFAYWLNTDFPSVTKVVGHGSPQANSLLSLAALAQLKGWQLDFYVDHIASYLKQHPSGNYRYALTLGANIIEREPSSENLDQQMRTIAKSLPADSAFVPEGGRCPQARFGIKALAEEIGVFCQQQGFEDFVVVLPSGTGTTALFLQQELSAFKTIKQFQVLTCACVGGESYLRQQFAELEPNMSLWPTIMPVSKKYHFGKLYPEFYHCWQQLKANTGVEFELLYDPLAWLTLEKYLAQLSAKTAIIYLHQGGQIGNESMLPRYQRKYGLEPQS